ncbi:MAG: SurA N-terminal domain-containing protein [Alphaproteobacteria bacterium]|nr:SurA N-terminal domain-containing protein [Alphaproteobacteria bacterium]MBU0795288.1 SurA N-terminal domain-containing protein [Alphaproteobacteria bacterium]MBU0875031.1 SurA N-terminal domain-containing protein [Alphaproteobacteria bacterium]MBU1769179.1 SurA N-terminal domain-containing protein [Alphaproteobacteria bacterium]
MQIFRRLLGSKFGGVFAIGFLALIAFAFVAGDMSGSNFTFGGSSSTEVAKIGDRALTAAELQSRAQMVFERQRQENPELTIDQFLADGGLTRVADELISARSLIAYGEKHGMRVSKALIDAEIARNSAFTDATGNFSETVFRQMLAQQRIAEQDLRDDIAAQIIQQHILQPVGVGTKAPSSMVPPYAAMLIEERSGEMFAIPAATFAPEAAPSDAQLQAFFKQNASQFAIPEQRQLRYALINLARFEPQAAPTEAEIADLYKSREKQFASRKTRDFSQLILANEAMAKDAAAKARTGQSLQDVAKSLGLAALRVDGVDESQLATQMNADIAKASFAAEKGGIVGPVRSPAGWAILRVEDVRDVPGKTLDQAREELSAEIRQIKERQLFSEFLNDIDGRLGAGATLDDLAKEHNLTVVETPLIVSNGQALRDPAFQPDETVQALLEGGFAAREDDDPQIVQVKPDEEAAILAVGDVVPAGPPPFAEVKPAVETAWKLAQGISKAREVATQLAAELGKGAEPGPLLAKLGIADAPRQSLSARRADINQQGGRIPPPLQALFSIRKGATRMVPLENNQGFVVVRLDEIKQNDPEEVPQLMQSTAAGLSNVLGGEYAQQFLTAIRQELGVTRSDAAMAAVEQELRRAYGGSAE